MTHEDWHLKEAKRKKFVEQSQIKILGKTDDKSTAVGSGKINKYKNIEPYLILMLDIT